MKKFRKALITAAGGLIALCLVAASLSALSNISLPTGPETRDYLDSLDKARLAEALHLKEQLGEAIWPGWGQADIPILLRNRDYSFLVGYPSPPSGWETASSDTFQGQAYYRQRTDDPQNFAVKVDDRWVASMATKWETDAFLIESFRDFLPPVIETIFPYRLLIQPSEVQITGVLHESFHVYQVQVASSRLEEAEDAHKYGDMYWQADEAMHKDWTEEINLLARALEAESDQEATELVRKFLDRREQRRTAHSLDKVLITYERSLEWEEGIAKYVELKAWQKAYATQEYEPLAVIASDPDFKGYSTFEQRWSQEIGTMKRQANREGETRFYYTGMAQAMLLDRLRPDWKQRVFSEGVWMETLLAEVEDGRK